MLGAQRGDRSLSGSGQCSSDSRSGAEEVQNGQDHSRPRSCRVSAVTNPVYCRKGEPACGYPQTGSESGYV
jgi:hypothetical protein